MASALVHIEKFLSNPILWGIAALIAIALGLSGRLSVTASTVLIWIACAMASFGAYQIFVYFEMDLALRVLATIASICVLGIASLLVVRWMNAKPLVEVQATRTGPAAPSSPPTTKKEARAKETQRLKSGALDPINGLTDLGWSIKNEKDGLLFEISAKPIPDMAKSAVFFRLLDKPFNVNLQQVSSIGGLHLLSGIRNLVAVEIGASGISDLSELHDFKELGALIVSQTPFNSTDQLDVSALTGLTGLRSLNLNTSRVANIEPVRAMRELASLNIGGTLVHDLSPLQTITTLRNLDVRDSKVTDLAPVAGSKGLEELSIDGKQVPSLPSLV